MAFKPRLKSKTFATDMEAAIFVFIRTTRPSTLNISNGWTVDNKNPRLQGFAQLFEDFVILHVRQAVQSSGNMFGSVQVWPFGWIYCQ